MDNSSQTSAAQYRAMAPNQQGQAFHQFPPPGHSQAMQQQQYAPRPNQAQAQPIPSSQYIQTRPAHPQSHIPGQGMPPSFPPSYSYPPQGSFVNPQSNSGYPGMSQMMQQPWQAAVPLQQPPPPMASVAPPDAGTSVPSLAQLQTSSGSDWLEHSSADGRRYYYNKKTRQSVWDKPLELMTPMERADASTVWKEYSSPDGRKYYYNKVTRQSKWTIPEELKLARELAEKEVSQGIQLDASAAVASTGTPNVANVAVSSTTGIALSPVAVTPVPSMPEPSSTVFSVSPAISGSQSSIALPVAVQPPMVTTTPLNPAVSSGGVSSAPGNANQQHTPHENQTSQDIVHSGASTQDIEEAKIGMAVAGKVNVTPVEDKSVDDEPLVYANKQEAKNVFKSLLESANVHSDWTWEQAMREIITDKRYGALKTLGERKQAFNEYLGQRRKLEAEEKRLQQKKAREKFTKMLEESKELTASTRWSKAVTIFENDERFTAVERTRDREDLFESYIVELERKEKEKAAEEHRRNVAEYKKFLQSCDFIKVNSQWRKVQDRLEDDERCLCLEKLDRLLIFQDHIRDLEKEEEEQKKIQKDLLRRGERKNRDEFRKLLEEHVNDGIINAKIQWRDYCIKVRDSDQYQAVASNTSGSTPKDLYEDVVEELERLVSYICSMLQIVHL